MLPLKITVRSISDSPAIHYYIHKHYAKFSKLCRKINSCKVVIDTEQKHGLKGRVFSVNIDLAIPNKEIVSKKSGLNLYVAIREAFNTLEHNLLKYQKRKVVKLHHYQRPYEKEMIIPEAG